ncbi:MAG: T9SS type A sorting domain-containing protein [Cyclobacteriaceae bacterium]|nr:T9SS type A sorting domain-containing protein [Cyclobacteriaceae bacterium]
MKCLHFILTICGLVFFGDHLKAQLIQIPVKRLEAPVNARTQQDSSQLRLPFWDDFSKSSNTPDYEKWFCCDDVHISAGIGIDPPTVNVASFDGWNFLGKPHVPSALADGAGDSLVSRFIDLSDLSPVQQNTLVISFFYQKQGHGDLPEADDSLRLQIKDNQNQWHTIWKVTGADVARNDIFYQQLIPILQTRFFHPWFQIRFQSFGRQSGGYDNWNIDYIYLNTGRTLDDFAYEDRALTTLPTSPFTPYTALPMEFFRLNPEGYLGQSNVGFYNLDRLLQPIEYSSSVRDIKTGQLLDVMNQNTVLDPNPLGFERRTIVSRPVNVNNLPFMTEDTLMLETKIYINSGDTIFQQLIDFRVNDTVRSVVHLANELAYDDGSAEFGAGLNTRGAQVAVKFEAPKQAYIRSVRIYFPEFTPLSGNFSNPPFFLKVLSRLDTRRDSELYRQQMLQQPLAAINQFGTYTFERPVPVSDTFYIAIEQTIDDFFVVGLDKNTNTSDRIFYNARGVWEPNTQIAGSLMIRPVFGDGIPVGLEDELLVDVKLYPNPGSGVFKIDGDYRDVKIYDLSGREVAFETSYDNEFRLVNPTAGIYLIRFRSFDDYKTLKLMVK